MKIRLVTVVWGCEYADVFLRVGLRTLLADGNAPALSRAHQVVYTIYTTAEEAKMLEAAQAFRRLRTLIDVQVSLFTPHEIDRGNYGSHGILWNRAIELARRNFEVVFFLIPDLLYAQGTLISWAARFESGAGAVFSLGPQVVLETVLPELETRFPDRHAECTLDRDSLLDLLFRHFHPLHSLMRRESDRRFPHPEYDLRLVPRRGFVIRSIVSHPFCIDPRCFPALLHYGPQDHVDRIVFEPCATLSVEPLLRRVSLYYRPWPLDELRLSNLGGWWNHFATPACEFESAFPYEICCKDDAVWRAGWREATCAGRFFRTQVIAAGRLYQLFVALRERHWYRAANLLACAVYAGRLRRRLCVREGATILLPSESALAADEERINELLVPGRERQLVGLIADHVLLRKPKATKLQRLSLHFAQSDCAEGDEALFTAGGTSAEQLLQVISESKPAVNIGSFTVYIIDRVLWSRSSDLVYSAFSGAADASVPRPDSEPASSRRPQAHDPNGFVVTQWGRRSPLHRVLYYASHIPIAEPLLAILLFTDRFPKEVGNATKRKLHSIRLFGTVLEYAKQMLGRGCSQNQSQHRAHFGSRVVHVRQGTPVYRCARLIGRLYHLVKCDGFRLAGRKAWSRIRINLLTWNLTKSYISRDSRELLNEIRYARTSQAVAKVLSEFESKMELGRFKSMPLELVNSLLTKHHLNASTGEALERQLREMTCSYPLWSEAWLELGFLYEDQGRLSEALDAFARSMNALRLNDFASRDPHPVAIAAAQRGRLLAKARRYSEACACYSRALIVDPNQKMVAVEYAEVLRLLGKVRRALPFYGDGMYYQESRWSLPPLPRDVRSLKFERLASRTESIRRPQNPLAGEGGRTSLLPQPNP